MSVREYIGARYVPVFADPIDWDSTKTYEPLTIVYYQGNSYTSRQAVPAGIDIANNAYWAMTGNYNAQIEQYRAEVATFDSRIEANSDAIADFNTELGQYENATDGRLNTIEANSWVSTNRIADNSVIEQKLSNALRNKLGEINELRTDLNVVSEKTFNPYRGTKSIGFGDSNMYGQTFGDESKCIYRQISNRLGCTYNNKGVNGARFDTGYSNNILNQITNATADNDVRLIVFIGGINDYHYSTYNYYEFINQIQTTINAAIAKYPNADIALIWDQGMQLPNSRMLRYASAMDEIRRRFYPGKNIVVPRTYDLAYGGDYYYFNQNHMNEYGSTILAQRTTDALLGHQNSRAFISRRIITNTDIAIASNLRGVISLVPNLDAYAVNQHIDIFIGKIDIEAAYTTILALPFCLPGNMAGGSKDFYHFVYDRSKTDSTNLVGVNFQQPGSNFESLTDSPATNFRLTSPHSFGATTNIELDIPLYPQE